MSFNGLFIMAEVKNTQPMTRHEFLNKLQQTSGTKKSVLNTNLVWYFTRIPHQDGSMGAIAPINFNKSVIAPIDFEGKSNNIHQF